MSEELNEYGVPVRLVPKEWYEKPLLHIRKVLREVLGRCCGNCLNWHHLIGESGLCSCTKPTSAKDMKQESDWCKKWKDPAHHTELDCWKVQQMYRVNEHFPMGMTCQHMENMIQKEIDSIHAD